MDEGRHEKQYKQWSLVKLYQLSSPWDCCLDPVVPFFSVILKPVDLCGRLKVKYGGALGT